jgi:hypothetical protein
MYKDKIIRIKLRPKLKNIKFRYCYYNKLSTSPPFTFDKPRGLNEYYVKKGYFSLGCKTKTYDDLNYIYNKI